VSGERRPEGRSAVCFAALVVGSPGLESRIAVNGRVGARDAPMFVKGCFGGVFWGAGVLPVLGGLVGWGVG